MQGDAGRAAIGHVTRAVAAAITERLLLWVLVAATLGLAAPDAASRARDAVPVLLGVMVFATGFTVPPLRLAAVLRRPARIVLVLALQFGPLSMLAYLLSRLPVPEAVSAGVLVLGVCPSEISSGVMVLLAGGDAALATAIVAASLLAGTVVTPLLLNSYAPHAASVDRAALTGELMLAVGLPLLVASTLRGWLAQRQARSRVAASLAFWGDAVPELAPLPEGLLATADRLLPGVAGLAVIALIFVVAGTTRDVVLSGTVFSAVPLCLAFNLAGYGAGWLLFRGLRAPELAVRSAVFTTGMREFGVAAAIATAALPAATGVAGLYGVLILITAPLLVRLYRRAG
jgi:BASS family bile acid:Na+ symporter